MIQSHGAAEALPFCVIDFNIAQIERKFKDHLTSLDIFCLISE